MGVRVQRHERACDPGGGPAPAAPEASPHPPGGTSGPVRPFARGGPGTRGALPPPAGGGRPPAPRPLAPLHPGGRPIRGLHPDPGPAGRDLLRGDRPPPQTLRDGMDALPGGKALWLPSLRRGGAAWPQLTDSLGALYTAGYDLNLDGWAREYEGHRVPGPTYPFQLGRHWFRETTRGSHLRSDPAPEPRLRW